MRVALTVVLACLGAAGCSLGVDEIYDFDGDGSPDGADCSPSDPLIFPNAPDSVGDDLDANCDGSDGVDGDGDGHASLASGGDDCNDDNGAVHPGIVEVPDDDIDNDCDGFDASCDTDGDGVLSDNCKSGLDCDDANSLIYPGAEELCDGVDTNCDGVVPTAELDTDEDGVLACAGDCDDENAEVGPSLVEACDGLDTNCDSVVPGDEVDQDHDGDMVCAGDCDDDDANRYGGAAEGCDGVDTDCDGELGADEEDSDGDGDPLCSDCDDDDPSVESLNADNDGFTSCAGDCNDLDPIFYPGAADYWGDQVDANCDGVDGLDADGDGIAVNADPGDCNDDSTNPNATTTYPDAPDTVGDAIDQSCDGVDGIDGDGDLVASVASGGTDCNDDPNSALASFTFPGAADVVADGTDTNCDGIPGTDDDGDGFASGVSGGPDCDDGDSSVCPECSDPWGDAVDANCDGADGLDEDGDTYAQGGTPPDCDDTLFTTNPGAADSWGDTDDTNCDGADGIDSDGDGWAVNAGGSDQDCDDTNATAYPGSSDAWGDGFDANCDSSDGEDADGDGWAGNATGISRDCDDDPNSVFATLTFPGAPDAYGDGVDTNCDASDGLDEDGDGYALNGIAPNADCNDANDQVYPGSNALWEVPANGMDVDCDGTLGDSVLEAPIIVTPEVPIGFASGEHLASAGDFDNDGKGDLLVGGLGPSFDGRVYLVLGSDLAVGGEVAIAGALATLDGEDAAQNLGLVPAGAYDIDDDGTLDIVVGAGEHNSSSGRTYFVSGAEIAAGGNFSLGDSHAIIDAAEAGEEVGKQVAISADVNGGGKPDLLIGAAKSNTNGADAGAAYLFWGGTLTGGGTLSAASADATLLGEAAGDQAGCAVAAIGDLDEDGKGDLLLGASRHNSGKGKSYLVLGSSIAAGGTYELSNSFAVFNGGVDWDYSGTALIGAGDIDGDQKPEILISAPTADGGGDASGEVYLFFGATIAAGGAFSLDNADATLVGGYKGYMVGETLALAGDADADGKDDILVGAPNSDHGAPGMGAVYLILGSQLSAGGTVDMGAADLAFIGTVTYDYTGRGLASVGDLNGDGKPEFAIGAPYVDNPQSLNSSGYSYLFTSPY